MLYDVGLPDNSRRHQYIAANVVKPTIARIVVPRSAWSKLFDNALGSKLNWTTKL